MVKSKSMEKKLITTGFLVSTLLGCMIYSLYKAEKVLQKQDSKTSSELNGINT